MDSEIDPSRLNDGAGVPHGAMLVRFVDAAIAGGDELAASRDEVAATLGEDHLIDAAAVVANFTMMTRIADGTGTPLDAGTEAISAELRNDLDLDGLISARVAPSQ